MNSPSLVCVGEVLVDFVPDASGGTYEPRLGGAPANVAVISAALGVPAALVSRVGDDWLGRFVSKRLAETGVDAAMVGTTSAKSGLAVVAPGGEGPPDFLMYRNGSADSQITLTPRELEALGSARVVHLSSLLPTSPEGQRCVDQVFGLRAQTGGFVSYDVNLRSTAWSSSKEMRRWAREMIRRAHVIKVTENELRWLDIDLSERDESALWLVTDGANGARLVGAHGSAVAAAPEVPVVDTTGAGDASLAAVLAMLIQDGGDPLALPLDTAQQIVQEAVSIGSRVVQHVGATAWLEGVRHD